MGHRVNYAIRRDGQVALRYSPGAALTLAQEVFWGPSYAEATALAQAPGDAWLDDVWAEGGLALDHDTQTCVWFAAHEVCYREALREEFLSLMRVIWAHAGWTVHPAERGQLDVAEAVGVDPATVAADTSRVIYTPRQAGERTRRDGVTVFLILVTRPEGVEERVGGCDLFALLPGGPALIDLLDELPTLEEVRAQELAEDRDAKAQEQVESFPPAILEAMATSAGLSLEEFRAKVRVSQPTRRLLGDRLVQAAHVDPAARTLRVVSLLRGQPGDAAGMLSAWGEWDAAWRCDTIASLYAECGRALPQDLRSTLEPEPAPESEPAPSARQVHEQIARALFPELDPAVLLDSTSALPQWPEAQPGAQRPEPAAAQALFRLALSGRE